ncbi:2-hydroxyacid dehydrogenase [Bdellovibrio sp. NC01]|uniref:2-hydroxyacid dehydrogenase n=1 Tax=Bdellovibrio sp. NC01 TaxID=2220073 RepID=UPI00115B1599|nr:2-hydroxyacid dehydrogenase [Bdellovibrio sp. NC01]QDK39599.1 2-hydroxyacid dehydrogenase [Bdellovibrio sp. NC01]
MKVAFFDTHNFEKDFFLAANQKYSFDIEFIETRLSVKTATLAAGSRTVCVFVNDKLDSGCVAKLREIGVEHIALRSAGFNNVDLASAKFNDLLVTRVPAYSPYAVAEFAVGILISLNRKIHHAFLRVRDLNFSLDGLVGFDLHGKKVGVIGAGRIGKIFAKIMLACGCHVLIYDIAKDPELAAEKNVQYVDLDFVCKEADVISLHVPLTPQTHHLINAEKFALMKKSVVLINTGRGALIDSRALLEVLKSESIAGAALDVYEEEENIFFQDLSGKVLHDDILARLLTFPNVLVTSHQAFLTKEALENIASTTLENINRYYRGQAVDADKVVNSRIFNSRSREL